MSVEHGAAVPPGAYDVWADDDEVIGLTVAKSYPRGYFLVRTEPPFMDGFDEFAVAQFLAWCLTNADAVMGHFGRRSDGDS